ncbi:von Willebrand factor D and EGF domain-containing protein-like [Branchiostoma floridae x Branchiostoma belcheri]
MDGMANPVSHRYQRGQFLRMFCLLFFCLISQQLTGVKATEDPCLIATEIYEPHRSTAYNVPPERPDLLCDRYLEEGWYRFTSHVGGRMPTSCVEPFYCGTSSPIWMNGEHPTGDDIVDRVACVTLQVPDYCCYGEYPIQVKRCIEGGNTFYVYKLTPTHVCNEAYCAGDQPPCPDGEVYNEFLRQCGDVIPMMTEDPVLHPPVVNDDWTQVTFTCEVKYDATDPTANFEVSFLFNNEYFDDVPNKILTARKRHATLDAKHLGLYQDYQNDRIIWPSKMGKHVSCEVRSFWENSPTVKSDWHQSNTYWAGIEASEHVAVIEERGELYPLQLYSTVPFVCSFGRKWVNQCYIKVPLDFDKNAKDASIAEACQITFKATDWDTVTHRIEAEAVLVAVKDFQADQDKHMVINFRQITQGSVVVGREVNPHIFHGYTPQFNVQVRTVDTITGRCISWGDPHIIMFDRPDDWNLQAHPIPVGEFNLYSSTKPNRLFQVQARHRQCAMNRKKEIISCNCGVAVREGDDAVIIDRCDGYYRPPSYKTTSGGPLSPGVTIKRDKTGNQIRITMPSGASVKVEGRIWMTITMHAPGIDFGHTEGLCGTFDGNPDNDLMMPDGSIASHHIWEDWHREFSSGWRIPHGTSLFDVDCLPEGPSSPLAQSQYCTCVGGGSVECDWTKTRQENPIAGVNTEVAPNQAQTNRECARRRRKREVQNIEDDPLLYNDDVEVTEYVFDYGEDSEPEVNDQWPTPSLGITEQQARDFCQQSIWNLTIAEACQDVYGVDLLAGVDSCIEDVQATEDYEFADIVVQRVQEECARNAYNNVSLYETNENGTAKPPAFITENLCPRQCSNQGRCVNAS